MQQRGEHLDGCGLPCPVRAEESEYLACGYIEGDVVDSSERAKGFDKILNPDHE